MYKYQQQQEATITMSTEMSLELASKILFSMYEGETEAEKLEAVRMDLEKWSQETKSKKKLISKPKKKLIIRKKKICSREVEVYLGDGVYVYE